MNNEIQNFTKEYTLFLLKKMKQVLKFSVKSLSFEQKIGSIFQIKLLIKPKEFWKLTMRI